MECPHVISGVSMAGLRKRMRTKPHTVNCHPCTFKAFGDSNEYWICLQCGHIGCGDSNAQDGDAKKHFDTPRSDDHSLVLHLEKDSRCWCYKCNKEIDSKSGHLREIIMSIKRNFKHGNQRQLNNNKPTDDTQGQKTTIAIPLPPPSPPPPSSSLLGTEGPKKKKKSFVDRSNSRNQITNKNRPAGLTNIGNTCFMNSALQCLASTKLLLPKLEIFGSGNPVRLLVSQEQDEASVTVLPEQELESSGSVGTEDKESGIGSIASEDENEIAKPLQITLEISPDSMTGRLREAFNYIRKSSDDTTATTSYGWRSFTPSEIQSLLVKQFRRGQQHDSHELLRTILDMMKKDQTKAFRVAIMNHYGLEKCEKSERENSDPVLVGLVKSLDSKLKNKTFVDEIFGGELVTTQTCLKCHFVKRSHEQFLDLSLPIRVIKHNDSGEEEIEEKPKPFKRFSLFDHQHNIVINKTLNDCLRSFTEPELLTGSNEVECENCHQMKLARQDSESSNPNHEVVDEEIENEFVVIFSSDGGEQVDQTPEAETERFEPPSTNLMSELSVLKLENEDGEAGGISDTDFDLPPAQDGIGGSPSESDDESRSSPVPSYLNLPTYDKFESYQYQAVDPLEDDPMLEIPLVAQASSSTKAQASASADDEGYSEGENSTAAGNLENESASGQVGGVSNGPSESSSRNSISDPDENLLLKSSASESDEKKSKKSSKPKHAITKCPCSRQQTISRPPEALTIHLKRFQMTLGGLPQKLNDSVAFPNLLDLTTYCCPQSQGYFDEDGEVMYSLYGIVEHSGSINWGHYVAYVKTGEGDDEQWWNISDSCVDSSTEKRALDQEAYILFYERVRGQEKTKRKLSAIAGAANFKNEDDCSVWNSWDSQSQSQPLPAPPIELPWDYPTVSIAESSPFETPETEEAIPEPEDDEDDLPALEPLTGSGDTESCIMKFYSENPVPLRIPRVSIQQTATSSTSTSSMILTDDKFSGVSNPIIPTVSITTADVYENSPKIEIGGGDASSSTLITNDDIDLL